MSLLYTVCGEVLFMVTEFITSPIGQLLCWGVATIWVFTYTLFTLFDKPSVTQGDQWRLSAAGMMCVYWTVNATAWFTSHIEWMIFTDFFFLCLAAVIFTRTRAKWSAYFTILHAVAFSFDIGYWNNLNETLYACLSNLVYVGQLYIVSGWKYSSNKNNHSLIHKDMATM